LFLVKSKDDNFILVVVLKKKKSKTFFRYPLSSFYNYQMINGSRSISKIEAGKVRR